MLENIITTIVYLLGELFLVWAFCKNEQGKQRRQWFVAVLVLFGFVAIVSYWLSPMRGAGYEGNTIQATLWVGCINMSLLVLYLIIRAYQHIKKYGSTPASK